VSTEEKPVANPTQSTDGSPINHGSDIDDKHIAEAFLLIYKANLWNSLSDECQDFGQSILQKMMDEGVTFESLKPIRLNLSFAQYIQIMKDVFNLKAVDSDFWKIVVQIQYLMMTIEKNPFVATQLNDPNVTNEMMSEIFGV